MTVVCGETIEAAADKIGMKDDLSKYAAVVASRKSGSECLVLISGKSTVGQIAHEAKHAVNMIFSYAGQRLDIENDEAECYLLQYVVEKIFEVQEKFKKQ